MRAKLTYDGGLDDDVVAVAPVLLAAEDVTQALEDARGDDQFHVLAHIEVEHVGGRAAVGAVGTLVHRLTITATPRIRLECGLMGSTTTPHRHALRKLIGMT